MKPVTENQSSVRNLVKLLKNRTNEPLIYCPEHFKILVVIFAWSGAEPEELQPFLDFYHEKGTATITVISPIITHAPTLAKQAKNVVEKAVNMIRRQEAMCSKNTPIFLHIFSKGGTILLQSLENEIIRASKNKDEAYAQSCYQKMSRIVNSDDFSLAEFSKGASTFDDSKQHHNESKEVNRKWWELRKTLERRNSKINSDTSYCSDTPLIDKQLFFFSKRLELGCQIFDSSPCFKRIKLKNNFEASKLVSRQLFIYSAADCVSSYLDIEEFMLKRSEIGIHVGALKFEDSKHVEHHQKYKKEYETFISCAIDAAACVEHEELIISVSKRS